MDLKTIEKAAKILDQIKVLDNEIIEIDRIAMLIASDDTKSSFELRIEKLSPDKEKQRIDLFDEDGSLKKVESLSPLAFGTQNYFRSIFKELSSISAPNKNETVLKPELSITATLQILGVILCDKQNTRQALLNQLDRMGVNI